MLGLRAQACIGLLSPLMDDLSDLMHLSPNQGFKARANAADQSKRDDAIADHQIARSQALLAKTKNLIPR